jgi:hypothetical protein
MEMTEHDASPSKSRLRLVHFSRDVFCCLRRFCETHRNWLSKIEICIFFHIYSHEFQMKSKCWDSGVSNPMVAGCIFISFLCAVRWFRWKADKKIKRRNWTRNHRDERLGKQLFTHSWKITIESLDKEIKLWSQRVGLKNQSIAINQWGLKAEITKLNCEPLRKKVI